MASHDPILFESFEFESAACLPTVVPLMIWATGRDPLTIYTRFRLSSYIWRVLWKAAAMGASKAARL